MFRYWDWLCRDTPERGQYKNGKEAFLAQVGYSVGIGNFWRFPYLCYLYGGATFTIAYFVCMVCIGLPLYMMELSLGQYRGRGPTHLFASMCPLLSGVGWAMILLLFMISVYYNVILAWSVFYVGASFMSPLPWSHCRGINEHDCERNSVNQSYESASKYFNHEVQLETEGGNPYELHLWLVLCLAVAWFIVVVFLVQGIRHTGKLFYVTVLYPYLVLLCLFGMNFEYIDKDDWIKSMTYVDYARLLKPDIWNAAISQIVFSLGLGHGLIMVASHNHFKHNVVRDSFLLCLLDLATSVFCSNVLFSLSVSISPQMIEDSNGISPLVFKVFSALLARKSSSLWAFLFFLMIYALGFDSLLLTVASVTTTLTDQFEKLKRFHPIVVTVTCFLLFLLGLSMCMRNGIVLLNVMDNYTAKHSLLFITLFEVVIASYFYGCRNVLNLMKNDLKVWIPSPVYYYLTLTWGFVTPVCLLVLCISVLYSEDWTPAKDEYIPFICGQVIAFAPAALVPVFAVYVYCTRGNKSLRDLVRATSDFNNARFRDGNRAPAPANGIPMRDYGHAVNLEVDMR